MKIKKMKFTKEAAHDISGKWYGKNWPVVYILNNRKEAYVGETISATNRLRQHLENAQRTELTEVNIISHDKFHKSAVLDIESKLIEYMSADDKYKLQNSNSGMRNHDYYQKEIYDKMFQKIWSELKRNEIVKNDLDVLMNSDLFKYTPYKRLTEEQYSVVYEMVLDMVVSIEIGQSTTTVINGEAGTGKTVMAMYLMKLFADDKVFEFLEKEDYDGKFIDRFEKTRQIIKDYKVALVVPMTSLRKTLKEVAKNIKGLQASMVIGPSDVVKDDYDVLIVDESHRLARRVGLPNYGSHDKVNRSLGIDIESSQLEWILLRSKHQIFFYDNAQSVRPGDVLPQDFQELKKDHNYISYSIISQLRVMGGNDYINYIKKIFEQTQDHKIESFGDYEFMLFENISDMKFYIHEKEEMHGLSRMLAGYAWEWVTKKKKNKEIDPDLYDIVIQDEKFKWNSTNSGWVNSKNAIHEVGSIHTIQGYDLNYAGIIIGEDLKYDTKIKSFTSDKADYYDRNGKVTITDPKQLLNYIINIYQVLLTRSIKGTFIYVVDDGLRDYLSQFIKLYDANGNHS